MWGQKGARMTVRWATRGPMTSTGGRRQTEDTTNFLILGKSGFRALTSHKNEHPGTCLTNEREARSTGGSAPALRALLLILFLYLHLYLFWYLYVYLHVYLYLFLHLYVFLQMCSCLDLDLYLCFDLCLYVYL